MKLYMFRTVRLSIIRSLFTVHSAMVHNIEVCRQDQVKPRPAQKLFYKPVWHIPLLSVQWINSWWWTDELSETRTGVLVSPYPHQEGKKLQQQKILMFIYPIY